MIQPAERAKEKIHDKNPEKTYMDDSLRCEQINVWDCPMWTGKWALPTLLGNERKYVLYTSDF